MAKRNVRAEDGSGRTRNRREPSPERSRWPRHLALGLAILGFIGSAGYSLHQWTNDEAASGNPVPQLTLETLQGSYTLGNPPGRVAILFFSYPG
jgi:hypothetical protein